MITLKGILVFNIAFFLFQGIHSWTTLKNTLTEWQFPDLIEHFNGEQFYHFGHAIQNVSNCPWLHSQPKLYFMCLVSVLPYH